MTDHLIFRDIDLITLCLLWESIKEMSLALRDCM